MNPELPQFARTWLPDGTKFIDEIKSMPIINGGRNQLHSWGQSSMLDPDSVSPL